MTVEDILREAIRGEIESYQLYSKAVDLVRTAHIKDLLRELAQEELAHKAALEKFLANPDHEPKRLVVEWPAQWPQPASGTWTMIEADSVYPVLEKEYRRRRLAAVLPRDGRVEAMLLPLSIEVFEWTDGAAR